MSSLSLSEWFIVIVYSNDKYLLLATSYQELFCSGHWEFGKEKKAEKALAFLEFTL